MPGIRFSSWEWFDNPLSSAHWKDLPVARLQKLIWAVFFTTTSIGFVFELMVLVMRRRSMLPGTPVGGAVVSSLFGAACVSFLSIKLRPKWAICLNVLTYGLLAIVVWLFFSAMNRPYGGALSLRGQTLSVLVNLFGLVVAMVVGYQLFLIFINREAAAHIRARNELDLAYRIQTTLVPPVLLDTPVVEIYGRSLPSEQVGGDLVDAVDRDGWAIAYILDISGHGVNAGILLGMCKSAVRTALLNDGGMAPLINCLNRVLPAVKESNMYATFGGLKFQAGGQFEYALAGHPAILHYRAEIRETRRLEMDQFPVGMFSFARFETRIGLCGPGDVFAVVTDGVLEVADGDGQEFGHERLAAIVRENADLPLPRIFDSIMERASEFGAREDDQTLLLVRVKPVSG